MGDREVCGGRRGDVAIAAAAEILRSGVSSEVVTSSGVVLRKVRWLGSWRSLKKPGGGWISILQKLLVGGSFAG
jgi:hypothetical protein